MPLITTEIEIPESLHTAIQDYLDQHPSWDINSFFIAVLSLHFQQTTLLTPEINRIYLDSLFERSP